MDMNFEHCYLQLAHCVPTDWLADWLADWLIYSLIDWLDDLSDTWLIDWSFYLYACSLGSEFIMAANSASYLTSGYSFVLR